MGFLATQYSGTIRHTLKGGDPESQSRDRYANNGLYGYADTLGREIVEPRYDYASDFWNGYATVGRGKVILPFEYDRITLFVEWDPIARSYIERGIAELNGQSFTFTLKSK